MKYFPKVKVVWEGIALRVSSVDSSKVYALLVYIGVSVLSNLHGSGALNRLPCSWLIPREVRSQTVRDEKIREDQCEKSHGQPRADRGI